MRILLPKMRPPGPDHMRTPLSVFVGISSSQDAPLPTLALHLYPTEGSHSLSRHHFARFIAPPTLCNLSLFVFRLSQRISSTQAGTAFLVFNSVSPGPGTVANEYLLND